MVGLAAQVNDMARHIDSSQVVRFARRDDGAQGSNAAAGCQVTARGTRRIADYTGEPVDELHLEAHGTRGCVENPGVAIADVSQEIAECSGIKSSTGDVAERTARHCIDARRIDFAFQYREHLLHPGRLLGEGFGQRSPGIAESGAVGRRLVEMIEKIFGKGGGRFTPFCAQRRARVEPARFLLESLEFVARFESRMKVVHARKVYTGSAVARVGVSILWCLWILALHEPVSRATSVRCCEVVVARKPGFYSASLRALLDR